MDAELDADARLELLARRIAVLEATLAAPRTRPELVADLDVSRSTVDRAVRELVDASYLTATDGGYRVTLPGRLAYRQYVALRAELVAVEEAADLLAAIPPDAPLPLSALRDAEVVRAGDTAPGPRERIADAVTDADRVRALSVAYTDPGSIDRSAAAVAAGTELSVVMEAPLYEAYRDAEGDRVAALLDTGRYAVWTVSELPFGLMVTDRGGDREVTVVVYSEGTALAGVATTAAPAAVAWANRTFRAYRDAGRRVRGTEPEDVSRDTH